MTSLRRSALVLLALACLGGPARANPYMDSGLFAEQVPGTRHVQLTWFDMGSKELKVSLYLRDGKAYRTAWKPVAEMKAELGSGVMKFAAIQACDCNVPVGKHVLRVEAVGLRALQSASRPMAYVEVVADKADRATLPPKPPDLQPPAARRFLEVGTACKAECEGVAALAPAPQPKGDQVDRSVVIKTGTLIQDGRYLRPPIKLEIAGLEVKANGIVLESFEVGELGAKLVEAYDRWVEAFTNRCLEVRCGGSSQSRWHAEDSEVQPLLAKLDEVVKSEAPRAEKLRRLRTEPALGGFGDVCAEQILDRWDGYR